MAPPAIRVSCHPLYAAVDDIAPQNRDAGFQLASYDLNDLKGHLPVSLFRALAGSSEWIEPMSAWRALAESDPSNIAGFKSLIWTAKAMAPVKAQ